MPVVSAVKKLYNLLLLHNKSINQSIKLSMLNKETNGSEYFVFKLKENNLTKIKKI